MKIDMDAEVSVKDIVNFYVKINDSSRAKREIARLSAKDKATAFEVIAVSSATRDFRVEVARYFINDLDSVVRRKSERVMEELVPDWVSDPAESILKLLKSAENKGGSRRDMAVKFLFGIVDANSLRDTFTALLNSRNRNHMTEILSIVESYIDNSCDESEQVKIFDACLAMVVSDDIDNNIKHYSSNLLSVFFKKVQSTNLGDILRRKFIEKQIDKAEGVYHYLCGGASGLNNTSLEDLIRPLKEGGVNYQIKILNYFKMVLEKAKDPDESDTVLDTYPDYWNQDEPPKEEKIQALCGKMLQAVDELWDATEDQQVRTLIVQIRFGEYANKRELLEKIRTTLEDSALATVAREKLAMMLRCFLHSDLDDVLRLQASQLLLFKIGDHASRLIALDYLVTYLEGKSLNSAEQASIATVMQSLLAEKQLEGPVRNKARYLMFIADPERLKGEEEQNALLIYLRNIIEGNGFFSQQTEKRVLDNLVLFLEKGLCCKSLEKWAQYLVFKINNPKSTLTWETVSAA
ncbi:MAG: hypothetical protein PHY09_08820 [Desulfuromonadaceae bacterium]|nr:hypothetical protein [Desulfuromonadaceae bacterium]MDD5107528.1 hypothetical protein [Desulfuromonadaceae bacterium]